jgi:LDH2 family malate/lactate/ureidoglycolate dehydrogenase
MEGSAGIFMPGEMEYLKEQEYRQSCIPVSPEVLKTLDAFAQKIGIAPVPR